MTVLCDLDGVVYRDEVVLPGVPAALRRLEASEVSLLYITNNSTRSPTTAAAKIERLTGVGVKPDQVLTSSRAAAAMLTTDDGPVLVVGEEGAREAVEWAGLEQSDHPETAATVLIGLTRGFDYDTLHLAMTALRRGARFVATNVDPTYPTADGLAPGCGAIVAAVAAASGREPEIAGKPHPPMRSLIRRHVGEGPVWVIGDRVDTDVALARGVDGWQSILVLTGVTGPDEAAISGADHVVADLPEAVDLVLAERQRS